MDPEHFQQVRGKHYPIWYKSKPIKFTLDYKPDTRDTILLTYPKAGTVWVGNIIRCILSAGAIWTQPAIDFQDYHLMVNGAQVFDTNKKEFYYANIMNDQGGVRFMWAHLLDLLVGNNQDYPLTIPNDSYNLTNRVKTGKYLLVLRNPKDVVVSHYYWLRSWSRCSKDIHEFITGCMNGGVWPEDYFKQTKLFWLARHRPNCTVIVYERLLADPSTGIQIIAGFLGQEYLKLLDEQCVYGNPDETLLDAIIRETSFDVMKRRAQWALDGALNRPQHFRKGRSGDWRSVLTRAESDAIDERCLSEWSGTGLETLWEQEMKY